MQAQDIEHYLADLGQELQQRGVQHPVRLLLIGGAFMLTQIHNRPSTNDIDVLLKGIEPSPTSPLYQTFKAAVRAVARKHTPPAIGSMTSSVIFSEILVLHQQERCGA